MVNTLKDEYVVLEIIPTGLTPDSGQLVQLSAIKLKGLELVDRFDYRLKEESILFKKIIDIISYDKDSFIYCETEEDIYEAFKKFIGKLPLLYISDPYTLNFIKRYSNKKEDILKQYNKEYSTTIIDELMNKYNIQPTNYIVDILYESLIHESNNKK